MLLFQYYIGNGGNCGPLACLSMSSVVVLDKDQDSRPGIGSLLLLFLECETCRVKLIFRNSPPFSLPPFQHLGHSLSARKAPLQQPSPTFTYYTQSNVTAVLFCLSPHREKSMCILVVYFDQFLGAGRTQKLVKI